jgi:hypothetical protein
MSLATFCFILKYIIEASTFTSQASKVRLCSLVILVVFKVLRYLILSLEFEKNQFPTIRITGILSPQSSNIFFKNISGYKALYSLFSPKGGLDITKSGLSPLKSFICAFVKSKLKKLSKLFEYSLSMSIPTILLFFFLLKY